MNKDKSIASLLQRLELDRRGWIAVDHWDGDRMAIGIARADEPRRLVYVSTFERSPGRFFFECETPTGSEETDFVTSASAEDASLDELLSALEEHLNPSQNPGH